MASTSGIKNLVSKAINKYVNMATSISPYLRFGNEYNLELQVSKEINVYNHDGSYDTVLVSPKTTSEQVCVLLTKHVLNNCIFDWTIVETWKDEGLERTLESHESVLSCYHEMENMPNRTFELRLDSKMFDMFQRPYNYDLFKSLDLSKKDEIKTLQKVLNCEMDPLFYGQAWIFDGSKESPKWESKILLLSNKKLFFSKDYMSAVNFTSNNNNGQRCFRNRRSVNKQNDEPVKLWSYLSDLKVYTVRKKIPGAPTNFYFCLVDSNGVKKYIACSSQQFVDFWICAMRLSKYGKQLRDNYRSFVKKHNDNNDYEYNKKPLPNESIRSHVAMDFTGNVGRIVEDPKEALAIAQADTGNVRRSWRSSSRTTPGLQVAVTKLENDIHITQPWYHKNMTREQAASVLNENGNNDGMFLIRESKSKFGSFVLSFKCGGKIIHTPILAQMENELVYFTLDQGSTRFYDLLQLVEFYQLNSGTLPTRLLLYVAQVPVTK